MHRRKAFEKPLPQDWRPTVGETVYVRQKRGTMSNLTSTGTVQNVLMENHYRVLLKYGRRQRSEEVLALEDLRPCKAKVSE